VKEILGNSIACMLQINFKEKEIGICREFKKISEIKLSLTMNSLPVSVIHNERCNNIQITSPVHMLFHAQVTYQSTQNYNTFLQLSIRLGNCLIQTSNNIIRISVLFPTAVIGAAYETGEIILFLGFQ
jgi:hypothetical protein